MILSLPRIRNIMEKKQMDLSTEDKIKAAARKIFTRKGYAATRTRDIAEESGINLALLNYYFRSKEKLFEIVMLENFAQFIRGISGLANQKDSTLDQKLEAIVSLYVDQLTLNPDLPVFVLNEIRSKPERLNSLGFNKDMLVKSNFMEQLNQELRQNKSSHIHPMHLVMNIFAMTIFPFVASPLIMKVGNLNEKEFKKMMEERKKWIPYWIKNMILNQ
jgi:AcrR family transcriptional regulator